MRWIQGWETAEPLQGKAILHIPSAHCSPISATWDLGQGHNLGFVDLGRGFCGLLFPPVVADCGLEWTSGFFSKGLETLIVEGSEGATSQEDLCVTQTHSITVLKYISYFFFLWSLQPSRKPLFVWDQRGGSPVFLSIESNRLRSPSSVQSKHHSLALGKQIWSSVSTPPVSSDLGFWVALWLKTR